MAKSTWYRVSVDEAQSLYHDNPAEMLKTYDRMRDIARKRLNRLRDSEYSWTEAAKKMNTPALKDMDIRDLPKAFSELSKFLSAKASTVSGQRAIERKTTATLNDAIGEKGVNHQNYSRVIQLFQQARRMKILYDSAKIVELANTTMGVNNDAFGAILDNLDSAIQHRQEFTQIPELDGYSFSEIQKML